MLKLSHRIVIAWCALLLIGLVVFERYIYTAIFSTYLDSGFSLQWSAQDLLQVFAGCYLLLLAITGRFLIVRTSTPPSSSDVSSEGNAETAEQ